MFFGKPRRRRSAGSSGCSLRSSRERPRSRWSTSRRASGAEPATRRRATQTTGTVRQRRCGRRRPGAHPGGDLERLPGADGARAERRRDRGLPTAQRRAGPLGGLDVPELRRARGGVQQRAAQAVRGEEEQRQVQRVLLGRRARRGSTARASPADASSATSTAMTPSSSGRTSASARRRTATCSRSRAKAAATTPVSPAGGAPGTT